MSEQQNALRRGGGTAAGGDMTVEYTSAVTPDNKTSRRKLLTLALTAALAATGCTTTVAGTALRSEQVAVQPAPLRTPPEGTLKVQKDLEKDPRILDVCASVRKGLAAHFLHTDESNVSSCQANVYDFDPITGLITSGRWYGTNVPGQVDVVVRHDIGLRSGGQSDFEVLSSRSTDPKKFEVLGRSAFLVQDPGGTVSMHALDKDVDVSVIVRPTPGIQTPAKDLQEGMRSVISSVVIG